MASFNRDEYERVMRFARDVYREMERGNRVLHPLQREARTIMDMVEGCIGQQDRPDREDRRKYGQSKDTTTEP